MKDSYDNELNKSIIKNKRKNYLWSNGNNFRIFFSRIFALEDHREKVLAQYFTVSP